MLENAVYDHFEMAVLEMVREGLLGELVHVEGGYAHPSLAIVGRLGAWNIPIEIVVMFIPHTA